MMTEDLMFWILFLPPMLARLPSNRGLRVCLFPLVVVFWIPWIVVFALPAGLVGILGAAWELVMKRSS